MLGCHPPFEIWLYEQKIELSIVFERRLVSLELLILHPLDALYYVKWISAVDSGIANR